MLEASTLQFLFKLAKGIASQFGPNCEVVVHDLATNDPESSIVAIENGQVTGRKVGDGPSHVVLEALRGENSQLQDHLSYLTKTRDGKILKSTTIYIRDDDGDPIGDLSSTTMGGMDRMPTDKELAGGIMGQGVMSILGAFFGGLPAATYSQNVGIVTVNRVINRAVFALAALILLVAGLMPKFASLLTTIPQSVIGGATISVFATITMTGIRMITEGGFTPRKSSVVGLSVALGVGITQVSGCLAGEGFPSWVNTVFGSSSVVVATLMAIILNLVLPKENTKR